MGLLPSVRAVCRPEMGKRPNKGLSGQCKGQETVTPERKTTLEIWTGRFAPTRVGATKLENKAEETTWEIWGSLLPFVSLA